MTCVKMVLTTDNIHSLLGVSEVSEICGIIFLYTIKQNIFFYFKYSWFIFILISSGLWFWSNRGITTWWGNWQRDKRDKQIKVTLIVQKKNNYTNILWSHNTNQHALMRRERRYNETLSKNAFDNLGVSFSAQCWRVIILNFKDLICMWTFSKFTIECQSKQSL